MDEITAAEIRPKYELMKMIPFLARCIYKQELEIKLEKDELRALSNIVDDLGGWDIDPKDFHW